MKIFANKNSHFSMYILCSLTISLLESLCFSYWIVIIFLMRILTLDLVYLYRYFPWLLRFDILSYLLCTDKIFKILSQTYLFCCVFFVVLGAFFFLTAFMLEKDSHVPRWQQWRQFMKHLHFIPSVAWLIWHFLGRQT